MRIENTESEDTVLFDDIDIIFPDFGSDNLFLHISSRKQDSNVRRGVNIVFDSERELMGFILSFHLWLAKTGEKAIQETLKLAIQKGGD